MNYLFGSATPATGAAPGEGDEGGAEGRVLRVRIGPSLSTMATAAPNEDAQPHFVDSPFFVGNVAVRVRNFRGRTPDAAAPPKPESAYFGTRRRLFSIQMQGRFKHEFTFDDVVFGAEFENKVNPPTGAWVAMKFANMIDPALQVDLYAEKPWLYSPALCAMNIANVVRAPTPAASLVNVAPADALRASAPKPLYKTAAGSETSLPRAQAVDPASGIGAARIDAALGPWIWGEDKDLPEANALLLPDDVDDPKFPETGVNERRRFFGHKAHREEGKFTPDYIYNLEIFAPFIDFNTYDLNLGISVNLVRYLNNQPIRLVCKSISKNIPFFIVEFDLEKEH